MCGETTALGAILTVFDDKVKKPWYVGYYNHTSGAYTQIAKPFADQATLEAVPMLDCNMLVETDLKIFAAAVSRNNVLIDDYNYDLPDTTYAE